MIAGGRLADFSGAYLMLVMLVLIARIPWLERAIGQDRLVRWHRRIGPWPIWLIAAHVALITLGYAESAKTGVLRQFWVFLTSYPDILMAVVGFALLVLRGRRRSGSLADTSDTRRGGWSTCTSTSRWRSRSPTRS